jgi:hypothetical protein
LRRRAAGESDTAARSAVAEVRSGFMNKGRFVVEKYAQT